MLIPRRLSIATQAFAAARCRCRRTLGETGRTGRLPLGAASLPRRRSGQGLLPSRGDRRTCGSQPPGSGIGDSMLLGYKPAEVSALIQFLIRPWLDVRLAQRSATERKGPPTSPAHASLPHIAVVDVETTGISPYHHNRIVELAVLVMQPDGTVVVHFDACQPRTRHWANERTWTYGSDLVAAPRFSEIAGAFIDVLDGCVARWP